MSVQKSQGGDGFDETLAQAHIGPISETKGTANQNFAFVLVKC